MWMDVCEYISLFNTWPSPQARTTTGRASDASHLPPYCRPRRNHVRLSLAARTLPVKMGTGHPFAPVHAVGYIPKTPSHGDAASRFEPRTRPMTSHRATLLVGSSQGQTKFPTQARTTTSRASDVGPPSTYNHG
ncbi:hypothetical protein QJS04_geneDACA004450 [Acorus gramineus]|uniref:Uncharacterized protein n=1 Tax=Acorus gramineus TaxID=55184 RepID=A0AAV9B2A5_ACOGR|nr:hypothetical protein QJS04_geneDACA004450 [Acorus gramineus]